MYLGGYGFCDFSFLIWLLLVNMRFIFHSLIYFHAFFISFHFVPEHLFHTFRVTGLIGINVVVDQTLHALNLASIQNKLPGQCLVVSSVLHKIPSKSPVFPYSYILVSIQKLPGQYLWPPVVWLSKWSLQHISTYSSTSSWLVFDDVWLFILWNWDKNRYMYYTCYKLWSYGCHCSRFQLWENLMEHCLKKSAL